KPAVCKSFHRAIAALELIVRRAERIFGGNAVGTDQVDRREQEIARFFQPFIGRSFSQFTDFLEQFVGWPRDVRPVETVACRALLELFRTKQRRKRPGDSVHGASCADVRTLGRLEFLPPAFLARSMLVIENMRMAG